MKHLARSRPQHPLLSPVTGHQSKDEHSWQLRMQGTGVRAATSHARYSPKDSICRGFVCPLMTRDMPVSASVLCQPGRARWGQHPALRRGQWGSGRGLPGNSYGRGKRCRAVPPHPTSVTTFRFLCEALWPPRPLISVPLLDIFVFAFGEVHSLPSDRLLKVSLCLCVILRRFLDVY